MSAFLLIIAICFGIWFVNKTNETIETLTKENQKLKREIAILKGEIEETNISSQNIQTSRQTIPSRQTINVQNVSRQTIPSKKKVDERTLTDEEKQELKLKKELNERERKNTTILIVGAVLIILAAIVFLMSTWNTISNVLKTVVLVLLIGVFFGASKIAKDRFKLEKASNTFFYLAMAYIPICLISCAVFGLFGDYLSIYGDGKYTYLAMSMVFTAGIYYLNYRSKKSVVLLCGSILSQICSVILCGLIFAKNIFLIAVMLLIYNVALILLTKKNTKIELLKYFYNGIPYIVGLFAIAEIFSSNSYMLVIIPLLVINYLLLYLKKDNTILNAYLFNIALYAFGIYICIGHELFASMNEGIKVVLGIIYIIGVLIIQGILSRKDNNLIKTSMVVSMVSIGIMYLKTLGDENSFIKPFMISIVEFLVMILVFVKSSKQGKLVLSYLIPSTLIITAWHILVEFEAGYQMYIVAALSIFIIGEFIKGKEFSLLNEGFLIISNINIGITYLLCAIEFESSFSNDVIFFILLDLVYVYSYFKNRKNAIFKYLGYSCFGLILLTGINFLQISEDVKYLIPLILTMIILILEEKFDVLKDEFSKIFINIFSVMTYITLIELDGIGAVLVGLLFSTYLLYDNFKSNENKFFRIIPMLGFMFMMFGTSIENEIKTIFLLLATTAITFISIYQKELSIETLFSGLYLIALLDNFEVEYVQEIFFIIWSFVNMYFMKSEKTKDIFRALLYFSGYLLYNNLLEEFELNTLTCWNSIGITVLSILYLRNIIIKYVDNIDIFEYLVYSIMYLIALSSYNSEIDGIIFVLFIVAVVMYSYVKKYGVSFIVSIFAILINAILLTREFWLSIPWWIYLLLVGAMLIAFAIKNESDDKKQKNKVGNVIKNIKDKIEK